ncbi:MULTISPECIES: hypothetical protein [Shewanella]|uniref:Uncharacterized protein n=1 Tax=Shewanella marisflavi TaxID=260364 RepID=A0ABX5WJ84_9GAMM|nr:MULTISPECIES: hypothetical protein [Shewanella]QDF74606.1 hypothetical protein FGA12_05240 [Shewanella marisflavi]
MALLKAIGRQWQQGKLAEKIEQQLMDDPEVLALFVGATSITTVANLITALGYKEVYLRHETEIPDTLLLTLLSDCFRLLVAKQLAHDELNQAEALIMQITKIWANKPLSASTAADETLHYQTLQQGLLRLAAHLDTVHAQRKQRRRNM